MELEPAMRFDRQLVHRRTFLRNGSMGVGALALATLLGKARADEPRPADGSSHRWRGVVQSPHLVARAKRVIFLCMAGGPSHLETFDHKPTLAEADGKPMPESFTKGQPIAQLQGAKLVCMGPQHPFKRFGQSGQEICQILPQIGSIADDICIIRSMKTEQINHDPAHTFMNTGTAISGRPSMGSWILYGLGSECDDLPGFVVLVSRGGAQDQPIASRHWHNGFLPGQFQGVPFQSAGDPVLYVGRPPGVGQSDQALLVDAVGDLDRLQGRGADDPQIAARISQYELAFKMQASVPELMDLSDEPAHVLKMYGTEGADGSFAGNCLLARRLAERGVRFVQLYHRGWDHHGNIKAGIQTTAKLVDQATAALIKDLKQRDMLTDTLVVWTGEFGRTPMSQGTGRDHHIRGFSLWLAGGGIRGGMTYGATDELGYYAVEDVVNVRDLHATMLHLLGIDYRRLTYPFQGLDARLTGVLPARVPQPILA